MLNSMPIYRTITTHGRRDYRRVNTPWRDLRHTLVLQLAENPIISERTICSLAGHVSRQMLEHYSHIRSQAKQAAIRCLEEQSSTSILEATGYKNGYSPEKAKEREQAKSLEINGGPARIRTWDQGIMSPLLYR